MRASPASHDKKVSSTYARYACGTFLSNSPPRMDVQPSQSTLRHSMHHLQQLIYARFAFRDIAQVCAACDSGNVNAKIVV